MWLVAGLWVGALIVSGATKPLGGQLVSSTTEEHVVVCCGPDGHYWRSECHSGPDSLDRAWKQYLDEHAPSHDGKTRYSPFGRSGCSDLACPEDAVRLGAAGG